MKKKILLVGGCGFIGHNLALYLKKVGHDPVIVDSLSVNNLYAQNNDAINANLYKSILLERIRLINKNNIYLYCNSKYSAAVEKIINKSEFSVKGIIDDSKILKKSNYTNTNVISLNQFLNLEKNLM